MLVTNDYARGLKGKYVVRYLFLYAWRLRRIMDLRQSTHSAPIIAYQQAKFLSSYHV